MIAIADADVFSALLPSFTFYVTEIMDVDGEPVSERVATGSDETAQIDRAKRWASKIASADSLRWSDYGSVRVSRLDTVPGIDIKTMVERAAAGDFGAFAEDPVVVADIAIVK